MLSCNDLLLQSAKPKTDCMIRALIVAKVSILEPRPLNAMIAYVSQKQKTIYHIGHSKKKMELLHQNQKW